MYAGDGPTLASAASTSVAAVAATAHADFMRRRVLSRPPRRLVSLRRVRRIADEQRRICERAP